MTILSELAALYGRRAAAAGWPRPGFSTENVGAAVVLNADGSVAEIRSLMAPDAKGKLQKRRLTVPAAHKRASGIKPNLFWDKTAYTLGVIAVHDDDGVISAGQGKRTPDEHAAFRAVHLELLDGADSPALEAFRRFIESWTPDRFADFPDALSLLDENVVFRLGDGPFLHDLPEAAALMAGAAEGDAMCLVTGTHGPVARLHPSIKGVMGAQSSGASLVSFNDRAYESHGKSQGDNAPVSERAAFAYGTALNALLTRGSGNNIRIGDATVAFWARGSGSDAEAAAEDALLLALQGDDGQTDNKAENILRDALAEVAQGKVPDGSDLHPDTRLFILGLAPNAARLSVRFWYPGTLGDLARHVTRFWAECAITPSPFTKGGVEKLPRPWALLYDLAAQRDAGNISPLLGGALMRSILTGLPYPAMLQSAIIQRLRVEGEPDRKRDGNVDGRRAAMLRAVLIRNHHEEVPMALDEDATDVAYLLGRLFGAYVYAERSYQERGAGLRQKYMGAASATPARVFPMLMRGYEHNLASLRKAGGQKAGSGVKADRTVAAIMAQLPGGGTLPGALPLEDQGRFFIGFYHQTSAFYARLEDAAEALATPHEPETTE